MSPQRLYRSIGDEGRSWAMDGLSAGVCNGACLCFWAFLGCFTQYRLDPCLPLLSPHSRCPHIVGRKPMVDGVCTSFFARRCRSIDLENGSSGCGAEASVSLSFLLVCLYAVCVAHAFRRFPYHAKKKKVRAQNVWKTIGTKLHTSLATHVLRFVLCG